MKKFNVPLIDFNFRIYVGESEYKRYQDDLIKWYPDADFKMEDYPGKGNGECTVNSIWIDEMDLGLLLHEMSHLRDNFYETLGCETECEFKANVASYVDTVVMMWYMKKMKFKRKKK